MNKEEAMKLAPGSIILVEAIAKCVKGDGVVAVSLHGDNRWHNYAFDHVYAKPEMPKYNPHRLFREGDRVRIVKHQGRKFNAAPPGFQLGKTYRVSEDENTEHCYVVLQSCDLHYAFPVAFLELVIPVEKLEPYSVQETMSHDGWQIMRDGLPLVIYDARRHPNAKAAAEAERDRLNAEWRKKGGTEVPCSEDGKEGNNE